MAVNFGGTLTTVKRAGGRLRALDGLRTVAVALVVVDHVASNFAGGGVGVNMFFVLSGFLITGILLRELDDRGSVRIGLFYARRALRLYPALLVMLAVTVLLGASAKAALVAATYTTNLFNIGGYPVRPYGHTWSLAAEEQFYLLWPLLLVVLARRVRLAIAVLCGGILASATAAIVGTIHMVHAHGEITPAVFNPVWQAHGLLIGCLLAFALRCWPAIGKSSVLAPLGLAGIAVVAAAGSITVSHNWGADWDLLSEVAAAALIASLASHTGGVVEACLGNAVMVWFGRRSYAIYLWHVPLILLFADHGFSRLKGGAIAVTLAVLAATLSLRFIEAPFLRMKDRLHVTAPTPLAQPVAG